MRRFLSCASGAGGRTCHSEAARTGWHGVLAQRAPPFRAAAKRRRGLGQAGLMDGRERRSLRSPSERLTAQRRELNENAVTGGAVCSLEKCCVGELPVADRAQRSKEVDFLVDRVGQLAWKGAIVVTFYADRR